MQGFRSHIFMIGQRKIKNLLRTVVLSSQNVIPHLFFFFFFYKDGYNRQVLIDGFSKCDKISDPCKHDFGTLFPESRIL